jgi:hypothetical protein
VGRQLEPPLRSPVGRDRVWCVLCQLIGDQSFYVLTQMSEKVLDIDATLPVDQLVQRRQRMKGNEMAKTVMGAVVLLDGFIADDNDGVGPLFDGRPRDLPRVRRPEALSERRTAYLRRSESAIYVFAAALVRRSRMA